MRPWCRLAVVPILVLVSLAAGPAAPSGGKHAHKGAKPETEPFGRFTVDQVERRLGRPNVFVFDGNPPDIYAENHLAGATPLSHENITPAVLPADKDATLIFYCMNLL